MTARNAQRSLGREVLRQQLKASVKALADLPPPPPLWREIPVTAGMIRDAVHRSDTLEDFAHHISEAAKAIAKDGLS